MKEIDWSKAPEDATHFWPNLTCLLGWYKVSENNVWVYDGGWVKSLASSSELNVDPVIERPKQAWDGEGNPPVGTVCDIRLVGGDWWRAKIQYITRTMCVWAYIYDGITESAAENSQATYNIEFRPIKTQEQIAAEEREKAIDEMRIAVGSHNSFPFTELYDAGYRLTKTKE